MVLAYNWNLLNISAWIHTCISRIFTENVISFSVSKENTIFLSLAIFTNPFGHLYVKF